MKKAKRASTRDPFAYHNLFITTRLARYNMAKPFQPPMHNVAKPFFKRSCRCISWSKWKTQNCDQPDAHQIDAKRYRSSPIHIALCGLCWARASLFTQQSLHGKEPSNWLSIDAKSANAPIHV